MFTPSAEVVAVLTAFASPSTRPPRRSKRGRENYPCRHNLRVSRRESHALCFERRLSILLMLIRSRLNGPSAAKSAPGLSCTVNMSDMRRCSSAARRCGRSRGSA